MLAIRLLGAEEARDADGRVLEELLRQPKRFALLAYLAAAEPQGFQRRDVLMGLLWPDADPSHARHALNQALYFLRQVLGNAAVVTRGAGEVALDTDVVSCDVWTFRQAIEAGNFEEAAALYWGSLLGGCTFGTSVAFEQWLDGERDQLSRSYARALERLAEACAERGERQEEIAWWRQLVDHDPYSTQVRLRLMAALDAAGDRAGALEQAARHAARLRDDLDAEPSPDTAAYAERLRSRPLSHGEIAADPLARLTTVVGLRYIIERELGSGGLATVYLARDLRLGCRVAVKALRPEVTDALGAELFLREIKITATLNHPLILPLLDSGQADGFLYYVMPYVEGKSLRDRLNREKQIPIDDSLTITREVADALGFAHEHGVLHRDIKPENILLEAGHAVVADFGVAGAIVRAEEAGLLEGLIAVGTPMYVSPEQVAGSTDLDGRSDLYSLGCVIYEMLAGEPRCTGPRARAALARKSVEPVRSLRLFSETIPPAIERVVVRALAETPAERFPTVRAFAEALCEAGSTER
ncbi:MAG: protein kinase [Gemmatimonadota bacterium]|nr:protein kinase [Gemmatimonadota bacterium]MDH3477813.1 protein kinase [Gemmatimonadota bacterium]MDH3570576.1 protein kinase [Gemmatimonadota bacterium]